MILIYWGYKLILLSIYGFAMWFIYKKFLKAKITNKAIKILIISVFCLLPFGDRILANIEGHYYLLTTPKPKDDIEVKYPFSLYYNIEPIDSEKLYNLIRLTYRNGTIESSIKPFNLDGNFINKIILNGSDGFLHMFSTANLDFKNIKEVNECKKEVKKFWDNANFSKYGIKDFTPLHNILSCKISKQKIAQFSDNFKNSEKIFLKKNMPTTDYTFRRKSKEGFFVLVYDSQIIDSKTNEIVYFKRFVRTKKEYWLMLHDAQYIITGNSSWLEIGFRYYMDNFKSVCNFYSYE